MNLNLKRIIQVVSLFIFQMIGVAILAWLLPGFTISSLRSLALVVIVFGVAQAFFWWIFVRFFARLPVWLYPIVTFVVNGAIIAVAGNLLRGIEIDGWGTGIWLVIGMTVINGIIGSLLSLDEDAQFDRNVTAPMVKRRGKPTRYGCAGLSLPRDRWL